MGSIAISLVGAAAGALLLAIVGLELNFRRKAGNRLDLKPGVWKLDNYDSQRYTITGEMLFNNLAGPLEIMVPDLTVSVRLLSAGSIDKIAIRPWVVSRHSDIEASPDGYWESAIYKSDHKSGHKESADISIELTGPGLDQLKAAWVQVHYQAYGPQGCVPKVSHVIVPLQFPQTDASKNWRPAENSDVLPIKTHLLTTLDTPVEVVKRYVKPHAQPGDIVTLGESPVAIMQGRFRHYGDVQPGWVARRVCYLFAPTSSLATACGLQTLVDMVGPTRVLLAALAAIPMRLVGIRGGFYRLAGQQARLIDDVTGTIPPYDKFIVMGPDNPQAVCDQIERETGLKAAIVDVNDLSHLLGRIKVLAASPGISEQVLNQALISNPAGNAAEQTPVVLIRPSVAAS